VETKIDPNNVESFLRDHDLNNDGKITREEWLSQKKNPRFFDLLDRKKTGVLTAAELEKELPSFSYQISTTETDVNKIREVAAAAFGNTLANRPRCDFQLVKGERLPQLDVDAAPDGVTKITDALRRRANAAYRDELLDYDGGAMFVVKNVSPAITRTDLAQRIRDMRFQPDYVGLGLRPTSVIGLTPSGEDTYSSFAVLVRPAENLTGEQASAWEKFSQEELKLLGDALHREEAMVATNFDPAIAGETANLAVIAVVLGWIGIIIYLWLRFGSLKWGLAAVICLVHDATIMVGLVAISGWLSQTAVGKALLVESFKIDLAMVAALLTIIGYSVNDTIVVFDRIRENRGKLSTVSAEMINGSINQTLSRTLLTSMTVFVVVLIMYIWGGPGLHPFNYALLAGVFFGTYSSIAVAAPILLGAREAITGHHVPDKVTGK
jgi:preprotein translocase SecF subunit